MPGGSGRDGTGSETAQQETVPETVQLAESNMPDVTGSETAQQETTQETVQETVPETVQPAEPKRSQDETGGPPETDMKNQTTCDALSSTTKLVFCTYIMVMLLESYPCGSMEWNGHYRIRQNLVLPGVYKQTHPHLQPPIRYEQHMMTVDSRLISLTNRPLQSAADCIMYAA